MALLWCEARCDGLFDEDNTPHREGESTPCHQTAPGAFGVRAATDEARQAGWRIMAGEWVCPFCIRRRARQAAEDAGG